MTQTIFIIILVVVSFDFLFNKYLDILNSRNSNAKLPDELADVYDGQKYAKQQAYEKENTNFAYLTSSFSFVILLLMLLFGGFAYVDEWARTFTNHPVIIALIFFAVLGIGSDVLNIPFSIYGVFVIEEKYGFNKTTVKTFITDKLKGWLLGAILGGGLLALIIWFYEFTGSLFWLYAWGVFAVFMIFMTLFYSSIIVPLFNKQKPLEAGDLRNAIQAFADKAGFKLDNIFVLDGSKRSTKANAYFSGIGPKKRIVLYDTLINDLETDEIVAVLAHEIGHYKKKHQQSGMVFSLIQTGITLFLLSLFLNYPEFSLALGVEQASFHIGIIAFGILYSPISMVLGISTNIWSRKNEYQADRFAYEHGYGDQLISSLKKLSENNLSNLTPHALYVFFHYSHPTLLQRILAIKKL